MMMIFNKKDKCLHCNDQIDKAKKKKILVSWHTTDPILTTWPNTFFADLPTVMNDFGPVAGNKESKGGGG